MTNYHYPESEFGRYHHAPELDEEKDVDPDNPDGKLADEPGYCPQCNGSGEGMHSETRCWACKGKGVTR